MKANVIVKMLAMAALVAAVLLVGTKGLRSQHDATDLTSASDTPRVGGEPLNEHTRTALGIEADTPADTVKTLVTGQRQQRARMLALQQENEQLRQRNQQLLNMEGGLKTELARRVNDRVGEIERRDAQRFESLRTELHQMVQSIKTEPPTDLTLTMAPPTASPPINGNAHPGATIDADGTVWIPPIQVAGAPGAAGGLGNTGLGKTGLGNLLNLGKNAATNITQGGRLAANKQRKPQQIPAYTVAKNSTLIGATALTALVGRVPVGGNVVEPYSFKAIVGPDNLIANGKTLPELQYAIVSGKAVGDWTLSCVSGKVYSITFVFEDGRIRTLPTPVDVAKGSEKTRDLKIGELSDDFGNPCVLGKRITNAGKYLAQRTLATAAQAAALAAAAAQTTTTVNNAGGLGTGSTTVVTGDKGQYILDETIAGAAREAAQWIRDRQAQEFDAIYVKPGTKVAVHVTEELRIDYDNAGRFTHHDGFAKREQHRELD